MSQYDENIHPDVEEAQYEESERSQDREWHGGGRGRFHGGPDRKSVAGASILSLLPGTGQIYAGYYQRGFTHALVVAGLIWALNQYEFRPLHPFFGVFLPFYWIYNIIDASRCAQIANRVARGVAASEAGEQLPLPGEFGGAASGIVLIVLGVLLLMVTRFDFDLRWLAEWWPAGLILLGANLVYRSRR